MKGSAVGSQSEKANLAYFAKEIEQAHMRKGKIQPTFRETQAGMGLSEIGSERKLTK